MNSKWIRGGCIAAAFFMAVTLFVGAEEVGRAHFFPPSWDKVVHFCYYGMMAILLTHGLGRRWWWIPLFAVPIVGVLDEWHQFYTPGRDASVFDWLADAAGTIVAVYGYRVGKAVTRSGIPD